MSTPHPCPFAQDDAAYVLGTLPYAERLEFERHLATCADCARSVREFAGLPGLLARVPIDVVESAPPPEPLPDTLLPALLDEVRRHERRRRWVLGLAAAAAVAAIAGASVAVAATVDDSDPPSAGPTTAASTSAPASGPASGPASAPTTAAAEDMWPVGGVGVSASVSMTSVAWGTRLDLTCSYAKPETPSPGYHHDESGTYTLVVRSADGTHEQVASWKALPGKTMRLTAATALERDDIAAVEVRSADGRPVLELAG